MGSSHTSDATQGTCRDPRARLSQITWRTGAAHQPKEDNGASRL